MRPKLTTTNHIALRRANIAFGAESQQTVIEEEHAKWAAGSNENVNPEIALKSIDEQWLVDVLLNDDMLVRRNPLGIAHQLNTVNNDAY